MRPTKEITLKIYCDKEEEFYLSLLKCRLMDKPDLETFKGVTDAIHFETENIFDGLELNETQNQEIYNKLLSVHHFLLGSKKNSNDYFLVGKEDFEQFKTSLFGMGLIEILKEFEILKQWSGKENDAEVKATIGVFSTAIQGIGESMVGALGEFFNSAFAIAELQEKEIKISTNKKGDLIYEIGKEKKQFALQLYYEQEGEINKLNLNKDMENFPDLNSKNSLYLYHKNKAFQLKQETDKIQTICFENVSLKNKKLDISKATITHTFTQDLKDITARNLSEEGDYYILHPKQQEANDATLHLNSLITMETTAPIDLPKGKKDPESSVFSPLNDLITPLLKLPITNSEIIANRGDVLIKVYDLLKYNYPEITPHISATITGYIVSLLGILDNEEQYDNSNRYEPYLKYLRNAVYNALKKKPQASV
jgi:hypothetical protein